MRVETRSLLVVLALGLFLSACSYQAEFREDFYRSQGGMYQEKYPYSVAVVVDERAKSVYFLTHSYSLSYMDFDFYEAIGKAMQQEQLTVFEQVTLVEEKSDANGYDILALVNINVTSDEAVLKPQIKIQLELTLKDLRDGGVLARQSQIKKFTFDKDGKFASNPAAQTCAILTFFSAYVLSPRTTFASWSAKSALGRLCRYSSIPTTMA